MTEDDYVKICKYIAKKMTDYVHNGSISQHVLYVFATKPGWCAFVLLDDRYSKKCIDEVIDKYYKQTCNQIRSHKSAMSLFNFMYNKCKAELEESSYVPDFLMSYSRLHLKF